jgi:hypothetical protein
MPFDIYPLSLQRAQQQDERHLQNCTQYHFETFCGGHLEQTLIYNKDKIVVPQDLQKQLDKWYHNAICHPGMTHTDRTIYSLALLVENTTTRCTKLSYTFDVSVVEASWHTRYP